MTRGGKSVGVQIFFILENISQKFYLKSPLESARRETLKSALRFVCLQGEGGCLRKGRRNPDFGAAHDVGSPPLAPSPSGLPVPSGAAQ